MEQTFPNFKFIHSSIDQNSKTYKFAARKSGNYERKIDMGPPQKRKCTSTFIELVSSGAQPNPSPVPYDCIFVHAEGSLARSGHAQKPYLKEFRLENNNNNNNNWFVVRQGMNDPIYWT